ncbi:MAG: efflux RND transporter permease subunit [Devosiaceae bacterium]|nr:efflux RND transporter permease subunit [Devosiaceae bacterium]
MMNMLEAILRRPKTVLTIMFIMLAAGISAFMTLPREGQPSIDIPFLSISTVQTGISPSDADKLLVRPLETELANLDGLKSMRSYGNNNSATIILEFEMDVDIDEAVQSAKDGVDRAKPNLPDDATDPSVNEISIDDFGTITVALYGQIPERTINKLAKDLKESIEGIGDVREVEISGDREEVLEIVIDQLKLESYNLTANDLFDALAKNNLIIPAGRLDTGQGRFAVKVPGLIESAKDVYNLPLKTSDDKVVTFSDVATIQRTFKDATSFTRVNGQPALILSVKKKLDTNIGDISKAVRKITNEHAQNWPKALQYSFMLDMATMSTRMFDSLQASVFTAVSIVLIVSIALLGLRPALLIGFSIPISFMIGFLFLQFMGMTINMMIMFGLVLTVGMLVDGAIVVTEYAERKISEGLSRQEAFIRAAQRMFWPIASSTATTLAAFLPLLLWPGIIGKFMSYLPIMVIVTLISSFIVAMIFIPTIGRFVARKKISEKEKASALALSGSAKFDIKKVHGVTGSYIRALSFLIRHPFISLSVGFSLVGGAFFLFASNPTGMVAFPVVEPQFATVAVTTRGNYSPVEIRGILLEVETEVLKVAGIEDVVMNFGSTGAVASTPPDTIGNFQLELVGYKNRRKAKEIFDEVIDKTKNISGVGIELIGAEEGPPSGKDINLRIEASEYELLAPTVAKIRDYVDNELGDVIGVEDGRPKPGIDWEINVDRDMAARFGIGIRDLSPYIQLVTTGVNLGTYRPNDAVDELDIVVRLPKDQRSFDALDSMRIITRDGLVPVSTFITRVPVQKISSIARWDQKYRMNIGANVSGVDENGKDIAAADKVAELKEWTEAQAWPLGTELVYGGADEQTNETNAFMVQAGLGAMFLMFLILLTQFNSFYQVFVTLSTVVMAVAGVLLGMLVTGQAFSAIMTGVGIISLAGIVVNNSIVLIDTYNRFTRKQKIDPQTAMLMTAAQRIRPVMLTTITTIFGLLPMAMGITLNFFSRSIEIGSIAGSWWIQLATAVIAGLSFSTLLTLVLVPVMLTAPSTIWASIKNIGAKGRAKKLARAEAKVDEDAPEVDSTKKYIKKGKKNDEALAKEAAE